VYNDLLSVIDEQKTMLYSIVVAACSDSVWAGGNIVMPPAATTQAPNIKRDVN
jgi:hypothetical protein